jgi:hypothetical protein
MATKIPSKIRKPTVRTLSKQFKAAIKRLANERDNIRNLICDMQQIEEDCTEAINDMERGVDALSKYL